MAEDSPVLERMKVWIDNITWEHRSPEESYQIVCDDYHNFKTELWAIRDASKKEEEKKAYQSVVDLLDQGTNSCHNWCCDEDCMDHFQSLQSRIRGALVGLKEVNM